MRDRTPTDYALEHAEYLAQAAEGFIDECNELAKAEMARDELCGDEAAIQAADEKVWQAKEAISEGMGRLRDCIHEFRLRHGRAKVSQHDPAVAAATTQQKVLDAALQWWCERQINDWDEADLAHALIDHEGDWPGCDECDHECDEPCMPATAEQQHAMVDHRVADLVHEGKLLPSADYTPPADWKPPISPRRKRQHAAMERIDRDGPMPGMIAAFETRYGGDWTDPSWRDETSTWAAAWGACLAARPANVARSILASDHTGMRVDYTGLMKAAQQCATSSGNGAHAFMLGELQTHLAELGQRFYAGDAAVVDEFLQLYCIGREERAALKKGSPS